MFFLKSQTIAFASCYRCMRKYLVVGASSGIGQALSEVLVSDGHYVSATYNQHARESNEGQLKYDYLNVLENDNDWDFLPSALDGVVYCPGAINLKPFNRIKPEDFIEDFRLQVVGAIKVIQKVLPLMKNSEQASIILFSTVAVASGYPYHSLVSASKGSIEGLTHALAAELAPKIRVNCIAPSITDTPLASRLLNTEEKKSANEQRHPLRKIGSPQQIAEMAAFLLSEKSSWITGQVMRVDGGYIFIEGLVTRAFLMI